MIELFLVFLNVILPVFGIVLIGMLSGKRLELQARTLSRVAYHVFVPAFIFHSISSAHVPFGSLSRMIVFIVLAHLLAVLLVAGLGRLLTWSRQMIAAFMMIAVFGNVGNFGLAIIQFRLGDLALPAATIYFVVINTTAFIVCLSAAGWAHGGGRGAVWRVLKTPAIWATIPAVMVSAGGFDVPLLFERMIGLLAGAMIPVMLFALGLQLQEQRKIHLTGTVLLASGVRLVVVPCLALLIAIPFHLSPLESSAGVLQAAMPTAVLVSIIAKENDIIPDFVTSVVVVSTLLSLVSLSVLMVFL